MTKGNKDNLKILDTDYAKEQYAKYAKQQRQIIFRRRRLLAVFVVAFVVFLSVGVSLFNDYLRLNKLEEVKQETLTQQKEVAMKVDGLTRDVGLLNDKEYVAKVARSRFLYSKDGELIFPLPGNNVAEEQTETTQETE
ncbi:septum formation initiator family protein [Enterococcus saccharolyticus]|uniref:Septum formation initiator n=1 Tax=Candidatus Enterococcus willemsii TaxID=1857215 RepID=A0ABQ6Z000_9ENTE|nr:MULTISPECIES: septum formation initiator family protein [Enterococcus]KAF1304187.1 septum formation initiator [Enterococcus sp. CU12B]MCD5001938.1 septum formation initiator family protein [Enterococcus saccharolyticus]